MAERKIGIIEFLGLVGEENVRMQPLLPSVVNVSVAKGGGSRVTFLTDQIDPVDVLRKSRQVGLVLWIEAETFEKARALANEAAKVPTQ